MRRRVVAVLVLGVVAIGGFSLIRRLTAPALPLRGPAAGSIVNAAALPRLTFTLAGTGAGRSWLLDGRPVTPTRTAAGVVYRPGRLRDGRHRVEVVAAGGTFTGGSSRGIGFLVDTTPPVISLAAPAMAFAGDSGRVTGTVEQGARVTAAGRPVTVHGGRFTLPFTARSGPGRFAIRLAATDAAGNTSRWRMPVLAVPRRPPAAVRGVHVTAQAWADDTLRGGVLALVQQGRINTVELDLKDEGGIVGWRSGVALARKIGAQQVAYDLPAAVAQLHRMGVRVVGRLVCFADPILAGAAWKNGEHDRVVQTADGGPWAGYGGFANPANPVVRRYEIDIAVAAARAGVDDVLLDYVRRPDGVLSSMAFPGLHTTPEQAIVSFLAQMRAALRPYPTILGASVFGVSATRPTEVAQDIPKMAHQLDYVAPMVYPSHWAPGEYRVADPNAQPYDIVRRSLADFQKDVAGSGARVMPWLQDFSLGRTYGAAEVQAQIRAAHDDGIPEFLLWNAGVTYTAGALTPDAPAGARGLGRPQAPPGTPALVRVVTPPPVSATPGATAPGAPTLRGARPNELGQIPVLMHHEIRPDRVGDYDQTPAEFRAELEQLWRGGYYPIRVADMLGGRLNVPAGMTPVAMTFDDSTRFQLSFQNGRPAPDSAVGIMLDFAATHLGFHVAGTFYVLGEPFGGVAEGPQLLRWLSEHGFELGDHTFDHLPLSQLDDEGVQRELVRGAAVIQDAVPGYRIRTMALPLGAMPKNPSLAVRGSWQGHRYGPFAVLLVGANPAPSPFSRSFDPAAIPRIRSAHAGWNGKQDYAAAYWLDELARNPSQRYVSDGDPARISFPRSEARKLAPAFRARARPT